MTEPTRADRRRAERDRTVPTEAPRAAVPYNIIIITAIISVAATAAVLHFFPYIFGLFKGDLKSQIVKEINDTSLSYLTRDVGELKTQVAVLQNSIDLLQKYGAVGQLKAEASKLGIKDPQLASVDMKPKAGFTTIYSIKDEPRSYVEIRYTIEEITKSAMVLNIAGTVFDRGKLYSRIGPVRQEVPLNKKTFTFNWTGVTPEGKNIPLPPVRIAILERSEQANNLLLATGLATGPTT